LAGKTEKCRGPRRIANCRTGRSACSMLPMLNLHKSRQRSRGGAVCFLFILLLCPVAISYGQAGVCQDISIPFFKSGSNGSNGVIEMFSARGGALRSGFLMPKPAGTVRVFTVGESVAQITRSGPASPLALYLRGVLDAGVENINAGMGGYGSSDVVPIVDEIAGYSPDVVVILAGNNGRNFLSYQCGFKSKLSIRAYTLEERVMHPSYPVEKIEKAVSLRIMENDLRGMVRKVKNSGALAVLCTLPASMKDFAPDGPLPLYDGYFAKAWRLMDKGDFVQSKKLFLPFAALHDGNAFAWYCLGICAEKTGDYASARQFYATAVEKDTGLDRASQERNEIIRRVAREEGAYLADLEKAFSAVSAHGIIDSSAMEDGVHWREEYMGLFVRTVADALSSGHAPLPFKKGMTAASPAGKMNNENTAGYDYKLYGCAMAYIKDWALGAKPHDDAVERGISMLARLYAANPKLLEQSLVSASSARRLMPGSVWFSFDGFERAWPHYLEHAGEFYRRTGKRKEALDCFKRALQADPQLYMAKFYRALAYIDMGDKEKAREDFAAIYQYRDKHPEIGVLAELEGMEPERKKDMSAHQVYS